MNFLLQNSFPLCDEADGIWAQPYAFHVVGMVVGIYILRFTNIERNGMAVRLRRL